MSGRYIANINMDETYKETREKRTPQKELHRKVACAIIKNKENCQKCRQCTNGASQKSAFEAALEQFCAGKGIYKDG